MSNQYASQGFATMQPQNQAVYPENHAAGYMPAQQDNTGAVSYTDPNDRFSMQNIIFDEKLYNAVDRMAKVMANGSCTVPDHLKGKASDCFAIICQAMRWGFDPYAVAQKTFLIKGILGYESQLIISVINARAPLVDRLNYEWFGPWENVVGKFVTKTSKSGNDYQSAGWTPKDEQGCGVRVYATMRGEEEPRVLELLLSQAQVRNSTLWASDPKQQLAYLAAKRWARLHAPEAVLGLYSPDELEERETIKNVTPDTAQAPAAPVKGTSKLKEKLKNRASSTATATVIDAEPEESESANSPEEVAGPAQTAASNPVPKAKKSSAKSKEETPEVLAEQPAQTTVGQILLAIDSTESLADLEKLVEEIKKLTLESGSTDHVQLSNAYKERKAYLEVYDALEKLTLENVNQVRELLNSKMNVLGPELFAELQDILNERELILQGAY